MQVNQPKASAAKASTPRYDTIVIRGAKGQTIPKEVDGGEVVAWSRGHELAAMDVLVQLVDALGAGNCASVAELTIRADEAMALMKRRRELGWDADEIKEIGQHATTVTQWSNDGFSWIDCESAQAVTAAKEFGYQLRTLYTAPIDQADQRECSTGFCGDPYVHDCGRPDCPTSDSCTGNAKEVRND
ncbi:TPA: hypothetical protein L4556_000354 [Pseudomonas aeruginosa]|nr:hypothetical protein [Pseudomonas aeruginosa]